MLPSDGYPEIVAVVVAVVLGLGARWIFRPSRTFHGQWRNAADSKELGLLTVVSTVTRAEAAAQRERLRVAGIRASTSLRTDGRFDLLVFATDADRAQEVLAD